MHITKLTYSVLTILGIPQIHTNLLWDLTFLFLILGVVYFISIFFFRNKLSILALRRKGKRKELAPVISNFLFHSPEDPREEQKEYVELKIKIREYLADTRYRKIISQILLDLQKDVAGATRERLFKLYRELGLHHDAFQKLGSWRWETVAQGILELSQMEVSDSYQLIRKFINDRRGVIRKQAELATVGLRKDGIDYVLDTTRHSISEWQQLKLIETLGKRKNYRPPQFKGWLLSQNKDVVLFALRLIKHYNQKGAERSINELVMHRNDEIKSAAIQCIVDFNFKSALGIFKNVFWGSSNTIKVGILNAIADLGSEDDISFLAEVTDRESNFMIVSKAQSTINAIVPETILPSKDIVTPKNAKEVHPVVEEDSAVQNHEVEEMGQVHNAAEYMEVEDLEFFDEVEIPNAREERPLNQETKISFELGLDEEVHQHLEPIESTKEDLNEHELNMYEVTDPIEKSKLIDLLGDTADDQDLPLLEHIAENETDSELRFQAFKAMKSIEKGSQTTVPVTNQVEKESLTLPNHSIFYDLYHHTDEQDAKLILLKEVLEIGDQKEIPFLESLLSEKNKSIVKAAKKAIDTITAKEDPKSNQLESEPKEEQVMEMSIEDSLDHESDIQVDDRIPMELFLLYEELGIESPMDEEDKSSPFDFEISQEFFLDLSNGNTDKQQKANK